MINIKNYDIFKIQFNWKIYKLKIKNLNRFMINKNNCKFSKMIIKKT